MSVFGSSGFHGDNAGTTGEAVYLGTPPGHSYVSKIDIQGYIALAASSSAMTAGLYADHDLAAGIQFGNAGYTPHVITDGSAGGASWWSYGNLLVLQEPNQTLPGLSPQNFTQSPLVPIGLSLRQYIYCAVPTDVYLIIGGDTSRSYMPLFRSFLTYNMEWATFP